MSADDDLWYVTEDGEMGNVANTYEAIKRVMRECTIDAVAVDSATAFYIDDNGMVNGERMNVPASMFAGRVLYGPCVMMAIEADREGNNLPPSRRAVEVMQVFASQWRGVLKNIIDMGQTFNVRADPDHVPPPQIVMFENAEDFDRWIETREMPT